MLGRIARSAAASLIAADRPNRKGGARDRRGHVFDRGKAAKAESNAWSGRNWRPSPNRADRRKPESSGRSIQRERTAADGVADKKMRTARATHGIGIGREPAGLDVGHHRLGLGLPVPDL